MIALVFGDGFLRSAEKLPVTQQNKLARLLLLLKENPFHPTLHAKPLSGRFSGLYSFRITRDWRVIFQFVEPRKIKLLDVAHRKDIYR